jgi:hypothetical protein
MVDVVREISKIEIDGLEVRSDLLQLGIREQAKEVILNQGAAKFRHRVVRVTAWGALWSDTGHV